MFTKFLDLLWKVLFFMTLINLWEKKWLDAISLLIITFTIMAWTVLREKAGK